MYPIFQEAVVNMYSLERFIEKNEKSQDTELLKDIVSKIVMIKELNNNIHSFLKDQDFEKIKKE